MPMYYSVKKSWWLINIVLFLFAIPVFAQQKPLVKKPTSVQQLPKPGVDNQHKFDSLKTYLDNKRKSRKLHQKK